MSDFFPPMARNGIGHHRMAGSDPALAATRAFLAVDARESLGHLAAAGVAHTHKQYKP